MLMEQATTARKEWSTVCDSVMHDKPKFIMRTRDKMQFSSLETISEFLKVYHFSARKYIEDDGSITLSLNEIDLVENGKDKQLAPCLMNKGGLAILTAFISYFNRTSSLIEK